MYLTWWERGAIVGVTTAKGGGVIDYAAMTILLTLSSISDLQDYQIPNDLVLAGWLSALVCRLYGQGLAGMGAGIFCIMMGIIVLMPLYCIRGMGAGDIKLLSVIGGMYGVEVWMQTGIVFAVLAAAFSLIHMLRKHLFANRICYLFHYVISGQKEIYYDAVRDGREMTIPLAPVVAMAYYIVILRLSLSGQCDFIKI